MTDSITPVRVKFKRIHGHAVSPTQAYRGDAGFDLSACEDMELHSGIWTNVRTGIIAAIPHGYWGHIIARSSTWRKLNIRVEPAVIDCSYRGELMMYCKYDVSFSDRKVISAGQRIAQVVIIPLPNIEWLEQMDLPDGERGERGYGSSGE